MEKRRIDKGMDLDSALQRVGNGRTRRVLNMHTGISVDGGNGVAETANGNSIIFKLLPAGDNKIIGSYLDPVQNNLYYFNYNSNGRHGIYRWTLGTTTVTTVLQDQLLNFNPDFLITGIDVAYLEPNRPILGWTDGGAPNAISPTILRNPPRQLDVNKAIAYTQGDFVNGYPAITVEVLDQIKYPPAFSPSVAIANDSQYNKNNLRGKLFQFKYRYIYQDFSKSAWSPISEIAVPVGDEFIGNAFVPNGYINNRIDVTLSQGSIICVAIEIAVRVQNSTNQYFYLWDTVSNFLTPTATFPFYNDKTLLPLDLAESVKLFDDVPRVAKAETIIAGNRKAWGNVVNQFNLVEPSVSFTPTYTNLPVPSQSYTVSTTNSTVPPDVISTVRFGPPVPIFGPSVYFPDGTVLDFGNKYGQYVVLSSVTGSWSDFLTAIGDFLVSQGATSYVIGPTSVPLLAINQIQVTAPQANGGFTVTAALSIVKYSSFKSGATHPFGIVYYDRANRSSSVIRNSTFDVYVDFITERPYNPPEYPFRQVAIDWAINHQPPIWATHYQWVYAKDSLTNSFLQFTVRSSATTSTQLELQLDPLDDYSVEYPNSILSYSYTEGDRMRVMFVTGIGVPPKYYDVAVTGYDETTFKLTCDLIPSSELNIVAGSLIEIYTPSNKQSDTEVAYYEFSEQFEIGDAGLPTRYHKGETQDQDFINGVPALGEFNHGDVWMHARKMSTTNDSTFTTLTVEDFNLSDFYDSAVWDKGRPNLFDKDFRETERPNTIYYSQPFIPETNVNGLGSVYGLNFGSDDIKILLNYKSIQALYSVGTDLFCFQELRTCIVPINNQTTIDVQGGQIAGAIDKVLNQVRYYDGYGICKNPESLVYKNGRFYHADLFNGVYLRLSRDGYTPISQLRGEEGEIAAINNFAQAKFKEINALGQHVNIYSAYDTVYDSVVFSVEDKETFEGYTISFFEGSNAWESFWSYRPDYLASNGQQLVSFFRGQLYVHDTNPLQANFYNTQYDSYIEVVSNNGVSESKLYKTISTEGNSQAWSSDSILVYDDQQVQQSILSSNLFEPYEGKFRAAFLMNSLTPNLTDPLIDGEPLRGRYMIARLVPPTGIKQKLFVVNFNFIPSAINLY